MWIQLLRLGEKMVGCTCTTVFALQTLYLSHMFDLGSFLRMQGYISLMVGDRESPTTPTSRQTSTPNPKTYEYDV